MLKFVLAALWISIATVGAVFFSFQMSQARNEADPTPAFFGGLDYVQTGLISVPVVKDGTVGGYFLARLVYTVEPKKQKALSIPLDTLMIDELYSYLYGNPQIDFSRDDEVDLDALRAGLRDSLNERVGEKLVHEVLVEQVDFLSKNDIRDNAIRRRIGPEGG